MPAPLALSRLDATAQAALVASGECTPEDLWAAAQARIDALEPLLGAVITRAKERPAPLPGPLRGVPFLMKDASPWPGLRWSMGSRLFAANMGPAHTPFSQRLAEGGLVCAGKTAISEFGLLGSTETLLEGVTHNPWRLSHSAAGSSGGSAAAVAAGLVPLAHANDGGGSIRVPASVCGVFGFKPGRGRTVPAAFATSDFLDLTSDGCVSRSVRDAALFLSLVEDRSLAAPLGVVPGPGQRRLRVGAYTKTVMGEEPEPAVLRAFDDALGLVASLGHRVERIAAPAFDGPALGEAFFLVAGAAIAGLVAQLDGLRGAPVQQDELEPFTWALVDAFEARGPEALPWSRQVFAETVRVYGAASRGYDVIATPTLATVPWPLGHLSPLLGREELIRRTARSVGYTPVQNIAGAPAMSVPLGQSAEGLPIGTHFAAAPGEEALLLGLAYELEAARPWAGQWPPYSIEGLAACRKS